MSVPEIVVSVSCEMWRDVLPDAAEVARRAAAATLDAEGLGGRTLEMSIDLADDQSVQLLNAHYRGQDKPTNVLSFEGELPDLEPPSAGDDGPPVLLGDVIVALETILKEAQLQNKSPGDHLGHLVVHGTLHLLGYDHEDDMDAEQMEAREREILAGLGIDDPYGAERDIGIAT